MNIISQPGHQGWPGLVTGWIYTWIDQARPKSSKFSLARLVALIQTHNHINIIHLFINIKGAISVFYSHSSIDI
jgi:hypothetical protein